jgi:hypothetical protein
MSHQMDQADELEEIIYMPPVSHHEPSHDPAFDVLPTPPPALHSGTQPNTVNSKVPSSSLGELVVPKERKLLTSFGSSVDGDPFASNTLIESQRASSICGPGQAGLGAGFNYSQEPKTSYGYAL